MNTSRKILSAVVAIIVTIAVFLLGVSLAITNAFSSAQPVKDALASSGVYEEFVGEAVDDLPGSLAGMISYEPELRDVVVEAAIPSMREDTEAGIDSLLAWLKGASDEITFSVEAAGAQEAVAKAVGNYVQERIEGLDECTFVTPNFNRNNPFIWGCKLPNTNAESYNTAFYEVVKNEEFWAETKYDLNDIIGISEQELKEDYQMYAAIYPSAVATAWISGIVIVLGAVAIWFLTRSVRHTLRPLGISFIVGGVLLIGAYIAGAIGLGIAAEELGTSDPLEAVTADIIAGLGGVAVAWLLWTGIITAVLGIAALVASFFVGKNGTLKASGESMSDTSTTDTPQSPQSPTPMQ
jgi:hypothetical protein